MKLARQGRSGGFSLQTLRLLDQFTEPFNHTKRRVCSAKIVGSADRPVAQTRETFVAPQHRHHVEQPR